MEQTTQLARPIVYDYRSPVAFFNALKNHYKKTSRFSIRQRAKEVEGCSPALVTQVLAEKRRLTRDQLPAFAKLFKLSVAEFDYLDSFLLGRHTGKNSIALSFKPEDKERTPKNHILSNWLNVYVKDLVNLKGFSLSVPIIYKMLFGACSSRSIEKSVSFLLKEGFWRKTPTGNITVEEAALVSTNEIPNEKIRAFHKQALKLAIRGIDLFPTTRRKASTVLVSVDKEKLLELRDMVDAFQNQLLKFIEDNPSGSDELIQITTHLTPVGVKND